MATINWKKSKIEGRIGVSVPYRQLFNDELKAVASSAKFDRAGEAWFFDEEVLHLVRPLLEKYYTNTKWYRVEWDISSAAALEIDGCNLLYISRDYWKRRSGSGFDMKIVECGLSSGGSRANPRIGGKLVLEIALREGAVISPEPTSIEAIDAPAPPANPLETVPTELIIRELNSRDEVLFDKAQVKAALTTALGSIDIADSPEAAKESLRAFIRKFNEEMGVR